MNTGVHRCSPVFTLLRAVYFLFTFILFLLKKRIKTLRRNEGNKKTLSKGSKPRFETIQKILAAFNLQLTPTIKTS
ncbi:hypothetical protein [Avibacterium paragallinarum]|uniref:hypothetical protein n=1 Tax=Avibacterium paragallinarum TaxID=728 RepID=UPI003BF4CC4B